VGLFAKESLEKAKEVLTGVPPQDFSKEFLEKLIMPVANSRGRGEVLWPLRVALSGKDKSPGPFEIMAVVGKEETLRRIKIALKKTE